MSDHVVSHVGCQLRFDPGSGVGRIGRTQPVKMLRKTNTTTLIRIAPKVGRNEPCPCGSGLKAKRCCFK